MFKKTETNKLQQENFLLLKKKLISLPSLNAGTLSIIITEYTQQIFSLLLKSGSDLKQCSLCLPGYV